MSSSPFSVNIQVDKIETFKSNENNQSMSQSQTSD